MMKISFEERDGESVFRIDDIESKYVPAFQMCFYQREGKGFIKKFSRNTKDLAVIQRNYALYAEEMFNQLGNFHQTPFLDHIVEPIIDSQGWVTRYFGVIFLHARIDVASDPQPSSDKPEPSDFGPFASQHLEEVTWNDYRIKVPPIQLYLSANKRRGRLERVKLIEEYITKNKS